jgi:hypothetical protein
MSTRTAHKEIVERLADSFMAAVYDCQQTGGKRPRWSQHAGIHDSAAAAAFEVEAQTLLKRSRLLRNALGRACRIDPGAPGAPAARAHFVELLEHELVSAPAHALRSFEALLGMKGEAAQAAMASGSRPTTPVAPRAPRPPGRPPAAGPGWWRRARAALWRKLRRVHRVVVPLVLLNAIILVAMAVGPLLHRFDPSNPLPGADPLGVALSVFAVLGDRSVGPRCRPGPRRP